MTEDNIDKLIRMNQRLLLVLGFGSSLILQRRGLMDDQEEPFILWFIQAVENIVYLDKPLPPMP